MVTDVIKYSQMARKIVFINQDSGYLMIDIINKYVEEGYECSLISGRIVERRNPLDKSVKISKIIRYNRNSILQRIFTWIWATIQIFILIRTKYRDNELFIVSNPPTAPLISLLVNNTYSVLIFDIYPDALVEAGYLSANNLLVRIWKRANAHVFNSSKKVFTISDGMKEVLQCYSKKTIEVVPIWGDNNHLSPIIPSENHFIQNHNLHSKFVVIYSGNIGLTSQIDTIVKIAYNCKRDDIHFLVIGNGARKKWLEKQIMNLNLKNILLLPWQPVENLKYSLSAANLAVVGSPEKSSKLALPSKLISYLCVGTPILCLADENTELAKFVEGHEIGKAFHPDQIKQIVSFIEILASSPDKCSTLQSNSLSASGLFNSSNINLFL